MTVRARRSFAAVDRPIAHQIGIRLRAERLKAGMTQAQLAEGRYTKAYVSALENGLVKPSMAALNFLGKRLGVPISRLLAADEPVWTRLEADLRLAAGDWQAAVDAYQGLLDAEPGPVARPELLRGLAEALCRLDRGAEAVRAAAQAATEFRAQGRHADAALAAYWEAYALHELEQGEEAKQLLQRILDEIAGGLRVEPDLPVRTLIALAAIETRDDQPEAALAHLERARGMVAELDTRRRATFLFSLAMSYRELGDIEAAIAAGSQSLAHFRASAGEFEVASMSNELALAHLARGDLARARDHAAEARATFERMGNDRWLAHVSDTEAQIELASGDIDRAVDRSDAALQLAGASGNRKAAISAPADPRPRAARVGRPRRGRVHPRGRRRAGPRPEPARATAGRAGRVGRRHGRPRRPRRRVPDLAGSAVQRPGLSRVNDPAAGPGRRVRRRAPRPRGAGGPGRGTAAATSGRP